VRGEVEREEGARGGFTRLLSGGLVKVVGDRVGRPRGGYSRGELRPACGPRRLLLLLSVDTVAARVRRSPSCPLLSFFGLSGFSN
jgi:hypothetical protein